MSEFLKFAYELLSQVVYNIVNWLAGFLKLFITGWVEYFLIFRTYFPTLNIPAKILSVLLMLVLFAVPIVAVVIIVRRVMLHHQLKADKTDNAVLYKEIGRLNKQVLSLIDEKNSILALKVNAMGGTERIPYMGASALTDDVIPTVENVTGNVPVRTVESTASTEAAAEVKETAEKAVEKAAETVEKTAEAAKTTAKKTATKAKAATTKKATAAKKTVKAKADAVKTETKKRVTRKPTKKIVLQYLGKEFDEAELTERAIAQFNSVEGGVAVKTITMYLKPEEDAAYYVINDQYTGRVDF